MIKLLSIGRFSYPKNFDNLPDICRRLVNVHGDINLKWYIVGFGDEEPIRRAIAESGMEEHVILLGKKENPYPYIKACDIYVQPSRYEGKSVTVREAQILCKPVVVTNYPTASSQIQDGIDGVIVPMDNDGCAQGIANVIADTALQQHLIDNLSSHDYGNESEVDKIYKLLE
jgi:glycosyltransferase involved in cell wall biosynthesis